MVPSVLFGPGPDYLRRVVGADAGVLPLAPVLSDGPIAALVLVAASAVLLALLGANRIVGSVP